MVWKKIERPPLFILILVAIELCLCFVYLFNYFVGQPFHAITALIDLDGEVSVGTWFSSMQLFLIALFFGIFAGFRFEWKKISSWLLLGLPLAFLFLSIDEAAMVHERIGYVADRFLKNGSRKGTMFHHTGCWIVLYGIMFFMFMTFLLVAIKKHFTGKMKSLIKLACGVVIFLGGAVGVEFLDNYTCKDATLHVLEVCLEEFLEMLGATIICWSAWELASDHIKWVDLKKID
jgi:hypothetical protein